MIDPTPIDGTARAPVCEANGSHYIKDMTGPARRVEPYPWLAAANRAAFDAGVQHGKAQADRDEYLAGARYARWTYTAVGVVLGFLLAAACFAAGLQTL